MKIKNAFLFPDETPKVSIDYKILNSCRRYRQDFGADPTICFVNPLDYSDIVEYESRSGFKLVHGTRVEPSSQILKNTFYVGEFDD